MTVLGPDKLLVQSAVQSALGTKSSREDPAVAPRSSSYGGLTGARSGGSSACASLRASGHDGSGAGRVR